MRFMLIVAIVKKPAPALARFAIKIRQNPAPARFRKSKSGTTLQSTVFNFQTIVPARHLCNGGGKNSFTMQTLRLQTNDISLRIIDHRPTSGLERVIDCDVDQYDRY